MVSEQTLSRSAEPAGTRSLARLRPHELMRNAALYPVLAMVVGLILAFSTHGFLTSHNIKSTLSIVSITGIAAVGLTAITISGSLFSLSTGATATVAAISYALLIRGGTPALLCLLLALLVALMLGLLQGMIVAAGMNPIVTTLAVGGALTGFAPVLSTNGTLELSGSGVTWIGQATIAGVALPVWEFALMTAVATILIRRTRSGRRTYLAGANRDTARATGLRPGTVTCMAFAAGGIAVGLAGIAGSAQVGLVSNGAFDQLTFNTITAVLVGGAAIQGGKGSPLGTAAAAVFVGLVTNIVELRGYSYGVQILIEGLLVCIAVVGYSRLARSAS